MYNTLVAVAKALCCYKGFSLSILGCFSGGGEKEKKPVCRYFGTC